MKDLLLFFSLMLSACATNNNIEWWIGGCRAGLRADGRDNTISQLEAIEKCSLMCKEYYLIGDCDLIKNE